MTDTVPFVACRQCKRRRVAFAGQCCEPCRMRLCGRAAEAEAWEEREAAKETLNAL